MVNVNLLKMFCCEDISKIENYENAVADSTQTWHCHHRKETDEGLSKQELIDKHLYVARPAGELILLTPGEHTRIHCLGKKRSEEIRKKISNTRKERIESGEIIQDLSYLHNEAIYTKIGKKAKLRLQDPHNHPMYGKHHSDESRCKMSDAKKGKPLSEAHRQKISIAVKSAMTDEVKAKISNASKGNHAVRGKHWKWSTPKELRHAHNKGKPMSEEQKDKLRKPKSESHKAKLAEARKGKVWVNNGAQNKLFYPDSIPDGWKLGRIKCHVDVG